MPVFAPHLEILPPAQRGLWAFLRPARELGFVLYGGTAVALRLGHRFSVDFDFFTDAPLHREAIRKALPNLVAGIVIQDEPSALTLLIQAAPEARPVKVSFFGEIGFGRVGTPDETSDGVLLVASLDDLLATKLKTILQRSEAKDYRDIAAMLREGSSLPYALAAARTMGLYGASGFQPSESLKALTYFLDGDLAGLPREDQSLLLEKTALAAGPLPRVELLSRRLLA